MKPIPWTELPSRVRVSFAAVPFLLVVLVGLLRLSRDLQAAFPTVSWLGLTEQLAWAFVTPYILLGLIGFGRLYWLNPITAAVLVGWELLQLLHHPNQASLLGLIGIGVGFAINWLLCEFCFYAKPFVPSLDENAPSRYGQGHSR